MKTGTSKPLDGGIDYYYCILDEPATYTDAFQNIVKWCDLQFGKRELGCTVHWSRNLNIFFFEKFEDALLFRLTWDS